MPGCLGVAGDAVGEFAGEALNGGCAEGCAHLHCLPMLLLVAGLPLLVYWVA